VGGLATRSNSRRGPSPVAHLMMRDDLSPHAGEVMNRGRSASANCRFNFRTIHVIASQRVARMRARRQAPRSNPWRSSKESWIASSQVLLAMTVR
jgi:hypothetical protein